MMGKEPATKHWDKNKMMKWLEEHSTATGNDVAFLKCEVENWKRVAMKAIKDSEKEKQQLVTIN
jgi:hypothetical protein